MEIQRDLRTYLLAGGTAAALLAIATAALPDLFYDRFIWKYFWGPVVADAANRATAVHGGVVAHRGYNLVNEIGYGLLMGYFLLILVQLLRRFDIGAERGFVLQFVPFVVFGGLLRVVEDAGVLSVPLRYLVISPLIYFTVFAVVLTTLLAAIALERRGLVRDRRKVVAGAGTAAALLTAALLATTTAPGAAWMLPASLGIAAVAFLPAGAAVLLLSDQYPGLERLIAWEPGVILYGHLLDGSATALSLEVLGYGEKHPVVAAFVKAAGSAYAFIALKLVVIGGILYWLEGGRDEDPRFTNLVLLGILAVGLGPGTRNTVRAVLGV